MVIESTHYLVKVTLAVDEESMVHFVKACYPDRSGSGGLAVPRSHAVHAAAGRTWGWTMSPR